ncbi:MAG: cyclase family protein, partial [Dehalococcoidia bacterium]
RDPAPGLSAYTTPWLHAREVAAVAADNYTVEVDPTELPPFRRPFHILTIPNMGLTLGELFYLDELAADCAQDSQWEFLLAAPPLPVTRGVGTPINPYAIK